jgi:hypothetical protein
MFEIKVVRESKRGTMALEGGDCEVFIDRMPTPDHGGAALRVTRPPRRGGVEWVQLPTLPCIGEPGLTLLTNPYSSWGSSLSPWPPGSYA